MSDEAPAEVPPTDPPTEDAPAAEKAPAATDEPREDEEKEETTENPVGGDAAVKVTTDGAEGDDLLAGAAEAGAQLTAEADDKKEEAAPAEEEAEVKEDAAAPAQEYKEEEKAADEAAPAEATEAEDAKATDKSDEKAAADGANEDVGGDTEELQPPKTPKENEEQHGAPDPEPSGEKVEEAANLDDSLEAAGPPDNVPDPDLTSKSKDKKDDDAGEATAKTDQSAEKDDAKKNADAEVAEVTQKSSEKPPSVKRSSSKGSLGSKRSGGSKSGIKPPADGSSSLKMKRTGSRSNSIGSNASKLNRSGSQAGSQSGRTPLDRAPGSRIPGASPPPSDGASRRGQQPGPSPSPSDGGGSRIARPRKSNGSNASITSSQRLFATQEKSGEELAPVKPPPGSNTPGRPPKAPPKHDDSLALVSMQDHDAAVKLQSAFRGMKGRRKSEKARRRKEQQMRSRSPRPKRNNQNGDDALLGHLRATVVQYKKLLTQEQSCTLRAEKIQLVIQTCEDQIRDLTMQMQRRGSRPTTSGRPAFILPPIARTTHELPDMDRASLANLQSIFKFYCRQQANSRYSIGIKTFDTVAETGAMLGQAEFHKFCKDFGFMNPGGGVAGDYLSKEDLNGIWRASVRGRRTAIFTHFRYSLNHIAVLLYCQEPYGRNLGKREFYDSDEAPEALFEFMGLYDRTYKDRMTPFGRCPNMHETSERFKIRRPSVTPKIPPTIRRPSHLLYQNAVEDLKKNSPRKGFGGVRRESSGGKRMKLKPMEAIGYEPSGGSLLQPVGMDAHLDYYEIDAHQEPARSSNQGRYQDDDYSDRGRGSHQGSKRSNESYGDKPKKGTFLKPVENYEPPPDAVFEPGSELSQSFLNDQLENSGQYSQEYGTPR